MTKIIILLSSIYIGSSFAAPLSIDTTIDGQSRADLSAKWWQWSMASPDAINPVRDTSGINCNVGQKGKIWFLAGGFGSSKIKRTCTVPHDKFIFFPVINMAYWPRYENSNFTCENAQEAAMVNNDSALDLFVEIDGVPVENPKKFRATTKKCFDIYGGIEKPHKPYNAYPSASDGYWVLLPRLSKGHHSIKFGGRYNSTMDTYSKMVQDIEYELTVN